MAEKVLLCFTNVHANIFVYNFCIYNKFDNFCSYKKLLFFGTKNVDEIDLEIFTKAHRNLYLLSCFDVNLSND